jgi:cobalt/nickel transport protein
MVLQKKALWWGLLFSLVIAAFIAPFASPSPDGLERVAADKGFLEKGEGKNFFNAPLPDYLFPGTENEGVATGAAGVLGTFITFSAMYGLTKLVARKNIKPRQQSEHGCN